MSQKTGFNLLKEKVPEFKNPLKMGFIITLSILVFITILIFFWWFDNLGWYWAIISQLILAFITILYFTALQQRLRLIERNMGC